MPMNPCGAVCALGRKPYTVMVRPFKDDPTEVKIQWYEALPGAPCLDVPSFLTPLDWFVQERSLGVFQDLDIGEVADSPRPYRAFKANKCATGKHRCGTADEWANGATYDPSRVIPRNGDGLPACCPCDPPAILIGGRSFFRPEKGLVMGKDGQASIILSSPGCFTSPWSEIPASGTLWVVMHTVGTELNDNLSVRVVTALSGVYRVQFVPLSPNALVGMRKVVRPSFCVGAEDIYEGDGGTPFTFDITATANRETYITVGNLGSPALPFGVIVTPLP